MFLVKNKLKRLKKDTDDEMLHYLKYSHLDNIPEEKAYFIPNVKEYKHQATQFPDLKTNPRKQVLKSWKIKKLIHMMNYMKL